MKISRRYSVLLFIAVLLLALIYIANRLYCANELRAFATLVGIPFAAMLALATNLYMKVDEKRMLDKNERRCYMSEMEDLLRHLVKSAQILIRMRQELRQMQDDREHRRIIYA